MKQTSQSLNLGELAMGNIPIVPCLHQHPSLRQCFICLDTLTLVWNVGVEAMLDSLVSTKLLECFGFERIFIPFQAR